MFRAMVWKELREIRGVLIFAVAAQLYLFAACINPRLLLSGISIPNPQIPFFDDEISRGWFFWFWGMTAIVLGLWQTLGESIQGTYPLLFHRPVTRRWLIGIKLLVGCLAYWTASVIAMILYAIWASAPGTHCGPFQWRMTIPYWLIWFAITILYFGAFLTGLRPGRWFLTRLLPLLASGYIAAMTAMFLLSFPGWLSAISALGIMVAMVAVILFVAQTQDHAQSGNKATAMRRGLISSLLLATILAIGAGLVWFAMSNIAEWFAEAVFPAHWEEREKLEITESGMPLINSLKYDRRGPIRFDLNRNRVRMEPSIRNTYDFDFLLPPIPSTMPTGWWWHIKCIGTYGGTDGLAWYLVHNGERNGRSYLVGYNNGTKLPVQYIGRNGFRHDKPPRNEQFVMAANKMAQNRIVVYNMHGHMGWRIFLICDDGLAAIEFGNETLHWLWKGNDVASAQQTYKDPLTEEKLQNRQLKQDDVSYLALIRTSDRIIGVDFDGREVEHYAVPTELRNKSICLCRLTDGRALVRTKENCNELFWINAAGKIVQRETVDLRVKTPAYQPWINRMAKYVLELFMIPSPSIITGASVCYPWGMIIHSSWQTNSLGYFTALQRAMADQRQNIIIQGFLGVILALFCYHRQRQFGAAWTWAWVAFVLAFGLLGFVGYLACRDWPARLPCPHCGRLSPRDHAACCLCGNPFPPPAKKGIEVFA